MTYNRESASGCPAGLKEQIRVGGVVTKSFISLLKGSQAGVATELHRYSVLVTHYVLRTGEYPPHWPKLDFFKPGLEKEVGAELTRRALRGNGGSVPGKKIGNSPLAYGTMPDILTGAPWFPQLFREIIARHPEFKMPIIDGLRKAFVVPNKRQRALRKFVHATPDRMAPEIATHVRPSNNAPLLVQGGGIGGDALKKETEIFPSSPMLNLERDSDKAQVKEQAAHLGVQGAVSINSQTQKNSLDNVELMNEFGLPVTVSVLPVRSPVQEGEENGHTRRFNYWSRFDDKVKQELARLKDTDTNPPIRIKDNENIIVTDFQDRCLDLDGKIFPGDMVTEENLAMILATRAGEGTTMDAVHRVGKTHGKFGHKGMAGGVSILKPKTDGVGHMFRSDGKTYVLGPRTIDVGRPFVVASGKDPSGIPAEFYFELTDDKVCHVYRTAVYGPFKFNTDSVQRNVALERAITLKVGGTALPFCGDTCRHRVDGICISSKSKEVFWKVNHEHDVRAEHLSNGLLKFFTICKTPTGEIKQRTRFSALKNKTFQACPDEGVTPDPALLPIGNTVRDWWTERPRGLRVDLGIIDVRKSGGREFVGPGCLACGKPHLESCKHGRFCHQHGCDEPECEQTRNLGKCHKCESTATTYCHADTFHCGRHSCPARRLMN